MDIPIHIAIVMDGNGRWAKQRSLPRLSGHNEGVKALRDVVKTASDIGIKHLTVYAFSTENWKRPEDEVAGIFKLLLIYVEKELKELHKNKVKINFIGDLSQIPAKVIAKINKALDTTKKNKGLQFNIALNYGSRTEIINAVKSIAMDVKVGKLDINDIEENIYESYLYTFDIPDPDLVIRTSGENRLSNFLLWQTAYSEFYFTDILWPDFKGNDLKDAVLEYQNRKRRYGGI